MLLFIEESNHEKKMKLFDEMSEHSMITWQTLNDVLPDTLVSSIIGISYESIFSLSFVNSDNNMFDSVTIEMSTYDLFNYNFTNNDEYYLIYSMGISLIRMKIFNGYEVNKYFDNYLIKKRERVIDSILK